MKMKKKQKNKRESSLNKKRKKTTTQRQIIPVMTNPTLKTPSFYSSTTSVAHDSIATENV